MSGRPVVISGCSGGGKSTLLRALSDLGYATIPEPGRRVIHAGGPRPEADLRGFLEACLDMAEADWAEASGRPGPVFLDRCAVEAVSGLDALGVPGAEERVRRLSRLKYASPVILAPPWPEIFEGDADRSLGLTQALEEYERLALAFPALGYATLLLPRAPIADRVAWIADRYDPPAVRTGAP